MNRIIRTTVLLLFAISWQACETIGAFEQNVPLPKHQWTSSYAPEFTLETKDSSAFYRVFLVLRHTSAYHFNNCWVELERKSPNDSVPAQKINVILANNQQGWLGSGMGDIFEHRMILTPPSGILLKAGKHQFKLKHVMREDPLEEIMNVGIRLEKVK
jgi:gliding motility-associated lipoprotein GldH